MKNSLIPFLIILLLITSCASDKSKIYDKAVETVKQRLKAPGSAKFERFDEYRVHIIDSAGKGNPFKEVDEKDPTNIDASFRQHLDSMFQEYDNTSYSGALVEVSYEAQNSFGVFLKGKCSVYLKRWKYKDGSVGEWGVFQVLDN